MRSIDGLPSTVGTSESDNVAEIPAAIGQGYLHVQSRLRITRDGGHSILAVSGESSTRLGRVSARAPVDSMRTNVDEGNMGNRGRVASSSNHAVNHRYNPYVLRPRPPVSIPPSVTSHPIPVPATPPSYVRSAFPPTTTLPGAIHAPSCVASSASPTNAIPSVPSSDVAIAAIINFLDEKRDQTGFLQYSFHRLCAVLLKAFPALSDMVQRENIIWLAEQRGQVVVVPKQVGYWVMLRSSSQDDPSILKQPTPFNPLNRNTTEAQVAQSTHVTPTGKITFRMYSSSLLIPNI